MRKLYSTGVRGTIGKHLPTAVIPIKLDLSLEKKNFAGLHFESNSNLLHLAGIVGLSEVSKNIEYARSVNVEGTKNLAQEFIKKCDGVFYFVSTSHVYSPSNEIIEETNPVTAANIYAEQKLEAETLLQELFKLQPDRLCIIRIFSVLDWDVAPFTLGGAIKKLTDSDFTLTNSSDVRDFLTPKTIGNALYEIATGPFQIGMINLCSSSGISVGEAAKRMLRESGFDVDESKFSWDSGTNPYVVGDNSRLKSIHPNLELSWEPSTLN
jgi:UDP-glucose 4-epimerase/GDP-4-dehydro-6-deoxy-D-mannose reductase